MAASRKVSSRSDLGTSFIVASSGWLTSGSAGTPSTPLRIVVSSPSRSPPSSDGAPVSVGGASVAPAIELSDPLKRSAQVVFHKFDELPRLVFEVHPFAKLW